MVWSVDASSEKYQLESRKCQSRSIFMLRRSKLLFFCLLVEGRSVKWLQRCFGILVFVLCYHLCFPRWHCYLLIICQNCYQKKHTFILLFHFILLFSHCLLPVCFTPSAFCCWLYSHAFPSEATPTCVCVLTVEVEITSQKINNHSVRGLLCFPSTVIQDGSHTL